MNAPKQIEAQEQRIGDLTDEQLLDERHSAQAESQLADLLAGEMDGAT